MTLPMRDDSSTDSMGFRRVLFTIGVLLVSGLAGSQSFIPPTTIVQVANGWVGEQFVIVVAAGSSTCPAGPNEYTIPSTSAAYKDVVAIAIAAFSTGSSVLIRPDGTCFQNNRAVLLELRLTH